MINAFFEIQSLKDKLRARGLEFAAIEIIAAKVEKDIALALREKMDVAIDAAIKSGVEKDSADFINELRPRPDAFILETESGRTDFSTPPYPMLDRLLTNGAKPMADGSGVYKIIPIGSPNLQPQKPIHMNIFDAQKAISVARHEEAVNQYKKVTPKASKGKFRTATSKQNRNTQWVLPSKEKDFTSELQDINVELQNSYDDIISGIIRSYEEGF